MSKGKTANGTASKQIEMRRCVACRRVRHKSELLRVVRVNTNATDNLTANVPRDTSTPATAIVIDETGKAPGRGGNVTLHPADASERCDSSDDMPTAPVILLDETGKAPSRGGNVTLHPADASERCDSSDMPTAPVILLDEMGKAPGRGAYVCKSPECAQLIKKRRCFDRAFKVKVPDELYDIVKEKILM